MSFDLPIQNLNKIILFRIGNIFFCSTVIGGFGVKVIAYDKYKFNYSDKFVIETDLETIFNETDILSLHVPLTEETTYMVDDGFINKFKKEIYLINTSRGKVVKTNDLVKCLSGKFLF